MRNIFRLLIIFVLCSLSASAQEQIDGINYYFNKSTHTAKVTHGSYCGMVKIPSEVSYESEVYTVNEIAEKAFYGNKNIESIKIPPTISVIGNAAFFGCENLKDVHIEDLQSWNRIKFYRAYVEDHHYEYSSIDNNPLMYGAQLYVDGEKMVNIHIPNDINEVGYYAFYGCSSIETVEVSSSGKISDYAFFCCPKIKKITFNGGDYNSRAFVRCDSIEEIAFLCDDYETRGDGGFNGSHIKKVMLSKTMVSYVRQTSLNEDPGKYKLNNEFGHGVEEYIIPDGVEKIGEQIFSLCDSLRAINIPSSVSYIGTGAFASCKKLEQVKIDDLSSWCKIEFDHSGNFGHSENPLVYGASLYLNDEKVVNLTIPESITKIPSYAFRGCSSFETITISEKTEVSEGAFSCNTNLKTLYLYSKSLSSESFSNCSSLTTVYLYNTKGNYDTFLNCNNIETVLLPIATVETDQYYSSNQRGYLYQMFPNVKKIIV